jgi:hypothetical protein
MKLQSDRYKSGKKALTGWLKESERGKEALQK